MCHRPAVGGHLTRRGYDKSLEEKKEAARDQDSGRSSSRRSGEAVVGRWQVRYYDGGTWTGLLWLRRACVRPAAAAAAAWAKRKQVNDRLRMRI